MSASRTNWKGIMLFLLPVVLLYCAFFLYPLVFVFVTGCTSWNGIKAMSFTGLSNYIKLFGNGTFRLSLRNNFIWAFALAFIQVPLATITAMILARKPRGWRFLRTVYFLPNVISQVAIAMMWMALYNAEYGILNHFLSAVGLASWTHNWLGEIGTALPAVIAQQVLYIGYFMIIILAGILSIPDSLYEAAEMDGAGVLRQELYVTLPMIRGLLVTSMTLAVAYGLRHFEATYLMTNGGPANSTSVLGLLLYKKMGALDYGQANAIGSVLVLTGVLLIIFIRRIFGRVEAASETVQ